MTKPGPEASFERILVAVDGSEHGLQAARTAARLAGALSAKLAILSVYHNPSRELGEPNYSDALRKALAEAESHVDHARKAVADVGGPEPETDTLGGSPAETIMHFAKDGDFDLVVIGTHGRGRIGAALLGSVSHAVASHSVCPVMVVAHEVG